MDVHNSLKFAISSGNVYCQCSLDSQKKREQLRKKREEARALAMTEKKQGGAIEQEERGRPP